MGFCLFVSLQCKRHCTAPLHSPLHYNPSPCPPWAPNCQPMPQARSAEMNELFLEATRGWQDAERTCFDLQLQLLHRTEESARSALQVSVGVGLSRGYTWDTV